MMRFKLSSKKEVEAMFTEYHRVSDALRQYEKKLKEGMADSARPQITPDYSKIISFFAGEIKDAHTFRIDYLPHLDLPEAIQAAVDKEELS
jgi:hypothetical protein